MVFRGGVALVTGAASGMGRCASHQLAYQGARVAALDVNEEALCRLARQRPSVAAYPVDVTEAATIESVVADVEDRLGPIDRFMTLETGPGAMETEHVLASILVRHRCEEPALCAGPVLGVRSLGGGNVSSHERSSGEPLFDCPVVVIAEDDHEMRCVLRSRLVKAGYRVHEAREGREALERVRGERALGLDWAPAALVSDVRMAGMDGLELLARVRTLDPPLPVILITAFGDPETHAKAKRLGATASLDKPLVLAQLLEALRQVVLVGAPVRTESR